MIEEHLVNEVVNKNLAKTGLGYTLQLIGGKYKISILYLLSLEQGPLRYNQLRNTLDEVPSKSLTNALNALTGDDLITRRQYPEIPPRVEYALTDRGKTLLPVLDALCLWGEHQLNQGADR